MLSRIGKVFSSLLIPRFALFHSFCARNLKHDFKHIFNFFATRICRQTLRISAAAHTQNRAVRRILFPQQSGNASRESLITYTDSPLNSNDLPLQIQASGGNEIIAAIVQLQRYNYQELSGDPTPSTFSKVLPYKWEAYCHTNGRRIAVQMRGVLLGFPFFKAT